MIAYMQMNRLRLTVSTQKSIIKSEHPSSRYDQKRDGLVCTKPNRHIFAYISGCSGPFRLAILALKLWALAGSFAYKQSYEI